MRRKEKGNKGDRREREKAVNDGESRKDVWNIANILKAYLIHLLSTPTLSLFLPVIHRQRRAQHARISDDQLPGGTKIVNALLHFTTVAVREPGALGIEI